jgi:transposase
MSEVRPFYHQELALLQGLAASTSLPVSLRDRAQMILLAHQGLSRPQIARQLGYRNDTVRTWWGRFNEGGVLGLFDLARPGAPRRLSVAQALLVIELAVTPPATLGLPFASWSLGKLRRFLRQGHGLGLSKEALRQVLARQGLSWKRAQSWQQSTDPNFATQRDEVVALYTAPPEGALVLCLDQQGPVQLRRYPGGGYAKARRAPRRPSDYVRHGTLYVLGALNPTTGQVWARAFTHYNRLTVTWFLGWLLPQLHLAEGQALYLIWDNHKAHQAEIVRRWLTKHYPEQVHLVFTPSKAAWLNLIEAWWTIFARDVLQGAEFESQAQFRAAVRAYLTYYNAQPTPFTWGKQRPKRLFRAGPLRRGPLRGRAPVGNLGPRFLYKLALGCCTSWTTH